MISVGYALIQKQMIEQVLRIMNICARNGWEKRKYYE